MNKPQTHSAAKNARAAAAGEREVQRVARALYGRAAEHKPSIFQPQDWLGKMIEWSLEDESLRVALFRFVDVLPSLQSAADIGRHLEQYFARVDHAFGGLVYLAQALHAGWLLAPLAKQNVTRLARRFIVEENPETLKKVLEDLRKEPAGFTLDLVGEATVSDKEALAMQERHLELIRNLAALAKTWRTVDQIDESPNGPVPRVNLSVKVSSLYARFDPLDPDTAIIARDRLRPIFAEAARLNAALTVDMEQYAFKELTLEIFRTLLEEDQFAAAPAAGIAIQAYLHDSERDVNELIRWARARKRRIGVRLVKGAYWDSEIAWARQKNWPIPVFLEKPETDANYERLTGILLDSHDVIDPAFGSHNLRSLAHAITAAKQIGIPQRGYEIQMLYGMGEPIRSAIVEHGERVRVYLPVGRLLPGMAYLIRRLMENTSNTSFLRQTYAEREEIDKLIAPPSAVSMNGRRPVRRRHPAATNSTDFRNEPPTDFARAENRRRFAEALIEVSKQFGRDYPSIVNGHELMTGQWIDSVNPAAPGELIGRAALCDIASADRAVAAAGEFSPEWRNTSAEKRAGILFDAAKIMRDRRFELAAWEVFEAAKGWREADADVVEAIDYLEYYGREMLRLAPPRLTQAVPGERNTRFYEPRGIALIIPPWNFPLAIPTGMTAAALVTGNCTIFKPAEQTPVLGAKLMEILRTAGLPDRACHLVQGGGEIGAHLVRHSQIHLIAFTGSREVGLDILCAAYTTPPGQEHVKRVICEMGGKNALIIDRDADLDEALTHIIESAFGYQGQKCSAASRLILLEDIHDVVLERLVEAARSLRIGPPQDPRNFIGPVIDAAAQSKIKEYIELGKHEGTCVLQQPAPANGFFVGPAIFSGIEPQHRLASEEIFGPVLSIMKAKDFDHALRMANSSPYALTGGVFSRSPANIEKARRDFLVGNLYINRSITGAVVERQPFGGLKLSGIGSKAGGPDYLLQFIEPRTVSENTLRHGFVPPEELT